MAHKLQRLFSKAKVRIIGGILVQVGLLFVFLLHFLPAAYKLAYKIPSFRARLGACGMHLLFPCPDAVGESEPGCQLLGHRIMHPPANGFLDTSCQIPGGRLPTNCRARNIGDPFM